MAPGRESRQTAGMLATAAWLRERLVHSTDTGWHVEVKLDVRRAPALPVWNAHVDTRFHIEIYDNDWGFYFCHRGRVSWIRITDVAFIHVCDDFELLSATPSLRTLGTLVRKLEQVHQIQFQRDHALVETNLADPDAAMRAVRRWIASF